MRICAVTLAVTLAASVPELAMAASFAVESTAQPPSVGDAGVRGPALANPQTPQEESRTDASSSPLPPVAPLLPPLGADSTTPMLIGAQYTFILQRQTALHSPYAGPLSLRAHGDTASTNSLGLYGGWSPWSWAQLYLDVENFSGEGVSDSTGLAGLSNGDVIREGARNVGQGLYVARLFARFMLPLGGGVQTVGRSQDHIPGNESATRLELKIGRVAATDDFDENRYANSPRTQFLNWALMNETAWDYPADTRGFTDGVMIGFISPIWSLKYGIYRMPKVGNGEALVGSLGIASGQNLQLSWSGLPTGAVVRLLAYQNTASMGNYQAALAIGERNHEPPDVAATDLVGRHKYGFAFNAEQPLADDGDTGLFLRWGWNDGREESFAFTEVDDAVSGGVQISGKEWNEPDAIVGVGVVSEGISRSHRAYLAAGGCGFLLCDGALSYGREQILETYYRLQRIWPEDPGPVLWDVGPDFQYVRDPGYNRARGPVGFLGLRLHLEY